jgi:hypothetical protein
MSEKTPASPVVLSLPVAFTDDQLADFERRWLKAVSDPKALKAHRRRERRRLFSRRTRLRLFVQHLRNAAGAWLVCHGHFRAAAWLWRMKGRPWMT